LLRLSTQMSPLLRRLHPLLIRQRRDIHGICSSKRLQNSSILLSHLPNRNFWAYGGERENIETNKSPHQLLTSLFSFLFPSSSSSSSSLLSSNDDMVSSSSCCTSTSSHCSRGNVNPSYDHHPDGSHNHCCHGHERKLTKYHYSLNSSV